MTPASSSLLQPRRLSTAGVTIQPPPAYGCLRAYPPISIPPVTTRLWGPERFVRRAEVQLQAVAKRPIASPSQCRA